MNIHLTGRQMELTPDVRDYCEKRIKSLGKLLESVVELDLVLSVEKYRHKVEINVKAKGAGLVVAEEAQDMRSALTLAFESLGKKLKKEREKLREKKRRISRERKTLAVPAETPESERRIIRSKDFSLKPMEVDEAVLHLDLHKKDIFVFRKIGSEKPAVIYRRKDGNYGLIEPE